MYLITNRYLCKEDRYFQVIYESVLNGVKNIIIREKYLDTTQLRNLFYKIKNKLETNNEKNNYSDVKLIINSNIKVFEDADADGIHLPFKLFNQALNDNYKFKENKLLGISTHSIEAIKYLETISKAKKLKIDYIVP